VNDLDAVLTSLRRLAWPLYGVAVLMVVLPLGDFAASVWPLNLMQLQWRFGAFGLVSGFVLTPLFGIVIVVLCAALLEHRVVQRVVAVLNLLGATFLVAVLVVFALDWLQFRSAAPPDARANMDVGSVKALIKDFLVACGLIWLAIAGWRASRSEHRARHSKPPLIREPVSPFA
jgi:hypothetical protein